MSIRTLGILSTILILGGCAVDADTQSHYTGANRTKLGNCERSRPTGSNLRKTRCGQQQDDTARLRHMGTLDSIAGHARTAGGGD